jgi:maleate isomerase
LVYAPQEESMTQAIRLGVIVPSVLDLALSAWDPRSDGIAVACLNFRSHPIIDALEARIGKPVVTSTQAVLWHLLRLAGVNTPIHGFGRLLREH